MQRGTLSGVLKMKMLALFVNLELLLLCSATGWWGLQIENHRLPYLLTSILTISNSLSPTSKQEVSGLSTSYLRSNHFQTPSAHEARQWLLKASGLSTSYLIHWPIFKLPLSNHLAIERLLLVSLPAPRDDQSFLIGFKEKGKHWASGHQAVACRERELQQPVTCSCMSGDGAAATCHIQFCAEYKSCSNLSHAVAYWEMELQQQIPPYEIYSWLQHACRLRELQQCASKKFHVRWRRCSNL